MKYSQTIRMLVLCFAILASSGCKTGTLGHLSINEPLKDTTVPGNALIQLLPLRLPTIPLNMKDQEEFEQANFDYLTEIRITAMQLDISASSESDNFEDGKPDNFDFLSSMEVKILANIDGSDSKATIAMIDNDNQQLSSGNRSITLSTTDIDIQPYIGAEEGYKIELNVGGNPPPDDVTFTGEVTYRVGIGFN